MTSIPKLWVEHDGIYKGCALGNFAKSSFSSSDNRSKGILDLVHSNLFGLIIVVSLGGFLYYVLFTDDYSQKTWIYFLKSKYSDEVLRIFQEFRAHVENLS